MSVLRALALPARLIRRSRSIPPLWKACWGKAEITGDLPAVFELTIEHFARQNGGEILTDAADPAQSLDRSAGHVVLCHQRLFAFSFHFTNHLQRHREPAPQTVHLSTQKGRHRAAVSGPHLLHVLFP